jgi:hypothetical protein
MKLLSLLLATAATVVSAQTPAPAKPQLTPEQQKVVLKQLEELEKSIQQSRGTSLGAIIAKLRSAASSDAAAANFVEDCDKLVNVERKDGDRDEERRIEQRKENNARSKTKQEEEQAGDHGTAVRLTLEYLALTLEANEAKDLTAMAPKLQAFHQALIGQGDKLKGRAGAMLMRPVGTGDAAERRQQERDISVVIEAYQLSAYLRREGWPMVPGDIIAAYDKLILKPIREKKKDELGKTWDNAINTETSYRKGRLHEGDFKVWYEQNHPSLRWQRATDLATHGPDPIQGMAEQLKVIKEFPHHAESPGWITALRNSVTPSAGDAAPPP